MENVTHVDWLLFILIFKIFFYLLAMFRQEVDNRGS